MLVLVVVLDVEDVDVVEELLLVDVDVDEVVDVDVDEVVNVDVLEVVLVLVEVLDEVLVLVEWTTILVTASDTFCEPYPEGQVCTFNT